jgi:hypothetical protein
MHHCEQSVRGLPTCVNTSHIVSPADSTCILTATCVVLLCDYYDKLIVLQCRTHFPLRNTQIWCLFWGCVTVMLEMLLLNITSVTVAAGFRILKHLVGHSTHYGKRVCFRAFDPLRTKSSTRRGCRGKQNRRCPVQSACQYTTSSSAVRSFLIQGVENA